MSFEVADFFLMLESASLNFPNGFRETETDCKEFPRAMNTFGNSSTADGRFNEKIRGENYTLKRNSTT